MKLSARDATAYFNRPEPPLPGLLIYGDDAMRVALKRQQVIQAMIGPEGESEMRLARHDGSEIRREPALVLDALKAQGFFPGRRVLLVEEATDGLAEVFATALADWRDGDAHLVATARQLPAGSKLRKLFEGHKTAGVAAIYDEPMPRAEIEAVLKRAGTTAISREAMAEIELLATALDPGDFRQTIEKLALYKLGDPAPVAPADVAAVAPASTEADVDGVVDVVAEGRTSEIAPILRRLEAQGAGPVSVCIAATRHFRSLHAAAADPEGPQRVLGRLRMDYKRRDRMVRQAQDWGAAKAGEAVHLLTDTDLLLRSAARLPEMALVERALIRLAMMRRR